MVARKALHRRFTSYEACKSNQRSCQVEPLEGRRLLSGVHLDPTFGSGGVTTVLVAAHPSSLGYAVTVPQGDGKILVAGEASDQSGNRDAVVTRLNPDGTPDAGFGSGGEVVLDYGMIDYADSIAVQADGKIVVGGGFAGAQGEVSPKGLTLNGHTGVVRLNTNGTLDGTFGSGGLALSDQLYPGGMHLHHIVIQPDGKVVEAGMVDGIGSDLAFALTRFTANGQIDTSFGNAGMSRVQFSGLDRPSDLTADASGNLLIAGTSRGSDLDVSVARLTPDGILDPTFGSGGKVLVPPAGPYTQFSAESVAVDAAGRVVIGGEAYSASTGNGYDFLVVRLTAAGLPDSSFGSGGWVTTNVADFNDFAPGMALQGDGKILVAGGSSRLSVVRYNPDGSLDPSFNGTGIYAPGQTNYVGGATGSMGITLQSNGNILSVGNQAIRVARLVTNSAPVAADDAYATQEDTPLVVSAPGVLANDVDAEGDPLHAVLVSGPTHGSLSFNADGSFTYSPGEEFQGADSFTYKANDGQLDSNTATINITVNYATPGARLVPDPCGNGLALRIDGTPGNDSVLINPASGGGYQVTLNGQSLGVFSPTRFIIRTHEGDDSVQVAGAVATPSWIFGGSGNDQLNAGNASSVLIGGSGNDDLAGGAGRDLLIGGQGADHLVGNANDDILIAGYTAFDNDESSLCRVMDEWSRTDQAFATRVDQLSAVFNTNTLYDDNSVDQIDILVGSSGSDWYIFRSGEDRAVGMTAQETAVAVTNT